MGSFKLAFFAMFMVIACGLSFLKDSEAAAMSPWTCAKDSDCDSNCGGKGHARCSVGHCVCVESIVESSVKPICSKDSDCHLLCGPRCLSKRCVNGKCYCGCPPVDQNESSLVQDTSDLRCLKSTDCHITCPPELTRKCVDGTCKCGDDN